MNRSFSYRLQRITVIKCSSEITNVKNQAFRWIFHLLHLSPYNNKNFIAVIENRRKISKTRIQTFIYADQLQYNECFKFHHASNSYRESSLKYYASANQASRRSISTKRNTRNTSSNWILPIEGRGGRGGRDRKNGSFRFSMQILAVVTGGYRFNWFSLRSPGRSSN